ncbi:hypothetical protein [Kitasatospora cineracea]|uniref:Uncharacterized protein n=1 Tax=Kitasatospora cineracea TaxID=88074 RepID=A0A8G1UG46_9ACTN|nr:hypothetical protein [Kitasatospora cineracea]ROR37919.1 hypothetical protein EDD39_6077 [Kitasatospora cineracea]
MAGETVQIDLDEVQAAAKTIAGLLDELNGPMNQLEAKVKQVQDKVYGSDLLGKSLIGETSGIGGLGTHQTQVLEGIREFLRNAAAVGANLQTMAARHQSVDEEHAADLRRLGTETGGTGATAVDAVAKTQPAVPLSAPLIPAVPASEGVPVSAEVPSVPAGQPVSAPAPAPAPAPGIGYHDPTAPDLDYNKPAPPPETHTGGGGGQRNYI